MPRKNPHEGSTFESFLEEEGMLAETRERAIKAAVAWQLTQVMTPRRRA